MPSSPSPIPLSQRVGWAGRRRWSRWSTPCPKATRANLKFEFRSPHFIPFVFRALADACSELFRNKEKQSKAFDFFVFSRLTRDDVSLDTYISFSFGRFLVSNILLFFRNTNYYIDSTLYYFSFCAAVTRRLSGDNNGLLKIKHRARSFSPLCFHCSVQIISIAQHARAEEKKR